MLYGEKYGASFIGRLRSLNKSYEALITDPGLINHLDKFEAYIKSLATLPQEPWAAREGFSEKLGSRVLYRVIGLKPENLADVVTGGMDSLFLRTGFNSTDNFVKNIRAVMLGRYTRNKNYDDPLYRCRHIPNSHTPWAAILPSTVRRSDFLSSKYRSSICYRLKKTIH